VSKRFGYQTSAIVATDNDAYSVTHSSRWGSRENEVD